MKIAVFGTGVVGNSIATKLVQLGHEVKMGSRTANNEKATVWVKAGGTKASQGTFADAAAFGEIIFPPTVDCTFEFVQHYCNGRKFIRDGSIDLNTKNGNVKFTYQFFNNGYNAFVFIFPIGESKKSRTTIIVSGYNK